MEENLDKTIDSICEWIRYRLDQSCNCEELQVLPDMVKSLADLVSARKNLFYE